MLEDRFAQHDKVIVDKYVNPIADYQMTTRDYVVRPAADTETGAITITLPPVAAAKGRFYSIVARNADGTNTITIQDHGDDSECWLGDIVFDGKCDRALLYSDGLCWHPCTGSPGSWPGFDTTAGPGTSSAPSTAAPTTAAPTTAAPTTAA
jgi:hypothetical protein